MISFMKDYIKLSVRNYVALSALAFISFIILVTRSEYIASAILIVFIAIHLWVARLFDRKSFKAVPVAYTIIMLSITSIIVGSVMNKVFDISSILGILIQLYLFDTARRAKKQLATAMVPNL